MPDPARLGDVLDAFSCATVLVVGDVMLDVWVQGEASRTTHESGRQVPIFHADRATHVAGGAANAALNLSALSAWQVRLVGLVGADPAADDLRLALPFDVDFIVDTARPTTTKTRYVSRHGHVARVDREHTHPIGERLENRILGLVATRIQTAQAVLLSDYAKGVLTPNVCQGVMILAREHGIPVIVDPKGADWTRYRGASLVTPNVDEALAVTDGRQPTMQRLGELCHCSVLLKRGAEGMTLWSDYALTNIAAHSVLRPDAVGAGDTVAAAATLALARGATPLEAAVIANAAAAVVCGKPGTATATRDEVRALLGIVSPETLEAEAGGWA